MLLVVHPQAPDSPDIFRRQRSQQQSDIGHLVSDLMLPKDIAGDDAGLLSLADVRFTQRQDGIAVVRPAVLGQEADESLVIRQPLLSSHCVKRPEKRTVNAGMVMYCYSENQELRCVVSRKVIRAYNGLIQVASDEINAGRHCPELSRPDARWTPALFDGGAPPPKAGPIRHFPSLM